MSTASFERLPKYLQAYTTTQDADRYTAIDHAAWRYIMRQSRAYFRSHAVPIYLEGLTKTGITFDRIPLIRDMDKKLCDLGWGAVPVEGFIPPAAFLDFQARRVLPIAYDMRSIEHIHYTPAPDIVHEAAGHAPILADAAYSEYITMYAEMARKALFARHDLDVYEAIRRLSDVKENPDCDAAMIADAEHNLVKANSACSFVSEAAKVARMNWWTVEYGLLGSLTSPRIYGAGLLSSVAESQNCLSDKVQKIRLSIDCVEQSYNITEPQPQLYVAEDVSHLTAVLKEYEGQLAFRRGGLYGLEEAKRCQTVATVVLGSGVEVSGILSEFECRGERVDFVKFQGPSQIAWRGQELSEQGVEQHSHGFSSPLGRWRGAESMDPCRLSDTDLSKLHIVQGKVCELQFLSGFTVKGRVLKFERSANQALILIKWGDCTVIRGDQIYFQPAWGEFDMVVGEDVVSVYGGPADREAFGGYEVGRAVTQPGRQSPFSESEKAAIAEFAKVRAMRAQPISGDIQKVSDCVATMLPDQWLLRLECLEILKQHAPASMADYVRGYETKLLSDAERMDTQTRWLVKQGVALAAQAD